MLQKIIIDIF